MLYSGEWMHEYNLSLFHNWFVVWLLSCVRSQHQQRNAEKSDWKLKIWVEFILAVFTRCRDEHHLVPFCIALSLYCYVNHVSSQVWTVLCFLRIIYNKDWTKKFAIEMAQHTPTRMPRPSKRLYVESIDNDFVLMKVGLQRVGTTHKSIDMISKVQHIQPEIDGAADYSRSIYIKPPSWQPLFRLLDPILCLSSATVARFWMTRLETGEVQDLARRPPGPMREASELRFLTPHINMDSSSGDVVER